MRKKIILTIVILPFLIFGVFLQLKYSVQIEKNLASTANENANIQDQVRSLQYKVDSLESDKSDLESKVDDLEDQLNSR